MGVCVLSELICFVLMAWLVVKRTEEERCGAACLVPVCLVWLLDVVCI